MSAFQSNLTQSVRQFKSRPGFTTTVVSTLAIAIGAATTIFSLFDAVLLRPFPYKEPDRIVRIRTFQPDVPGSTRDASVYDFWDWRRDNRSFSSMAAYVAFGSTLTTDGPARSVRLAFANSELFSILGVHAQLGTIYTSADDVFGGNVRKVILSHSLWQQLFQGQEDALNKVIQLRGDRYTVVGVMPPGFAYPDRTELWVPLMARYSGYKDEFWRRRDVRPHSVLARLKDGVDLPQAQADMGTIASRLRIAHPDSNRQIDTSVITLRQAETGELRPYLAMVGAAVLLLLIIGCVNIANLFVARAASREREFAIRAALGSGVRQIAAQLLCESLLYGVAGCLLGILLAWAGVRGLTALIPVDLPAWLILALDGRVLAFAVLTSLGTAVLFGLAPLAQHLRPDLNETLKQGAKGSSGGRSLAAFVRRALVVVEVALSLVLLIGAGLLMRSFAKLMNVNTGVETERLIVTSVGRFVPNATREQMLTVYANEYRRICDRLSTLPGVRVASAGNDMPYLNKPEQRQAAEIYTRQRSTRETAYRGPAQGADTMPGYFAALGIPLLEGRDFTEADTLDKPKVIIISKRAADLFFPGKPAIGEQLRWGNNQELDPWMTIVGVVGNTQWHPAERQPGVEVYWSYKQYPTSTTNLLVRTAGAPAQLIPSIRRIIHEVNANFAIQQSKTMETVVTESVWQRKLWGFVLTAFAAVALLLAGVGLYGVMSYLVSQRTRELGVRLAIGAQPSTVLRLVMGSGMRLVAVGGFIGLAGTFVVSRLLESLLFGVSSSDPLTYGGVLIVLLSVAALACAVPGIRASRIDPLMALREE